MRRSVTGPARAAAWVLLAVGLALVPGREALAAGEHHHESKPAPESVYDYDRPLEKQFEVAPERPSLLDRMRARPRLFEKSRLEGHFRSYYMHGKLKSNEVREAWTYGGSILFDTGWIADRVALCVQLFTSQPIHAPSDRDGTRLLRERQRQYAVFGQTYARLRLAEEHVLSLYRQMYDLPYLNKEDNRMTPNTFEGYSLQGQFAFEGGASKLQYIAGYVARIKRRNSDRFVSMGEAGTADAKRGLTTAALIYTLREDTSIGVYNHYVRDIGNNLFMVANHRRDLTDGLALQIELQHTDQRSVGDDLLTGSSVNTHVTTGWAALGYRGAILRGGFSTTSRGRGIDSLYGSKPSPVSLMILDFDRADEDAWLVGFSYGFSQIGLDGLSAFVNYARGNGARDNDGVKVPDQYELDMTVDYRFKKVLFGGLWLRARAAFIRERDGGASRNELRLILNYELPVL